MQLRKKMESKMKFRMATLQMQLNLKELKKFSMALVQV